MSYEFYQVEEHEGRKVIHYEGYLWPRGVESGEPELNDDGVECNWRFDEGTHCGTGGRGTEIAYVDAIRGSKYEFVWGLFEQVQQYLCPIADEEVDAFFDDASYLHMDDVTEETPCGCYWFELKD